MSSSRPSPELDLARDLPVTPEDVAAQRRARTEAAASADLAIVLPPALGATAEVLRRRRTFEGCVEFRLDDTHRVDHGT